MLSLTEVKTHLVERFHRQLSWEQEWRLVDIVDHLKTSFPEVDFNTPLPRSCMRPDGGILSILDKDGLRHPILITERKNQGTNDVRKTEGKAKQAKATQLSALERMSLV